MKNIFIILLFLTLLNSQHGWSQSLTVHDPSVKQPLVELKQGMEEGKLAFQFVQQLSDYTLQNGEQPIRMVVSLMNIKLKNGIASIKGNYADKFKWQYDAANSYLLATQVGKLEKNQLGEIEMEFLTTQSPSCENNRRIGFNVNIQPAACMNGINDLENDNVHQFICQPSLSTQLVTLAPETYKIYPNPTMEIATIEFTEVVKDLAVTILDVQGKIVKQFFFDHTSLVKLNVAQFPKGIYTLKLKTANKIAVEKLIVIQ